MNLIPFKSKTAKEVVQTYNSKSVIGYSDEPNHTPVIGMDVFNGENYRFICGFDSVIADEEKCSGFVIV